MRTLVRVVSSSESAARDASAIAAGIPSRVLMQRAGAAAASEIALRYRDRIGGEVLILAGPGNNGGDAWVVARALETAGAHVRVIEPVPSKTPDAQAERELALQQISDRRVESARAGDSLYRGEALIIDGLLGTGATGAPRGELGRVIEQLAALSTRDAAIVALDVPSGLDATTGIAEGAVTAADLTLTFGTVKRGHLVNREVCGAIAVLDIGLGSHASLGDGAPKLVDEQWVASQVPLIPASAHKGVRKKLAIVGGAQGMVGATILAARAAIRSGIGMVKLIVDEDSLRAVQESEPYALAARWPQDDAAAARDVVEWADAVVIGPGLGRTDASRELLDRILRRWTGPILLDADALTLFEGQAEKLGQHLRGRASLVTPHPVEFARLAGKPVDDVLSGRFDIGRELAETLGASVLLKGVPTIVTSPNGKRLVSASGNQALATAGSGDVLSGIAGTMLAQIGDAFSAGAVAAWVHGRAAERIPGSNEMGARGIALEDIVNELRDAWTFDERPLRYPVLHELPNVGARR
ncbi:MAG: NAD(P)H-hydrate epimerase [Gemmatimonadetes bacterium]|nr:NAD(P)H-hydrate epimerase [Gemmatimonadota bacterium]